MTCSHKEVVAQESQAPLFKIMIMTLSPYLRRETKPPSRAAKKRAKAT